MIRTRVDHEAFEKKYLASYGARSCDSRGRRFEEPEHEMRTAYQRDRDRILYSRAFRRLQYKTQVFVIHEGDHFRTRLTHTLEMTQLSMTMARALGLNEDLVESIALAHDLGHGPFGHAGEWAIHEKMKNHGGFEHNVHGLRIVEVLEDSYPAFPGLNLSYETLEGMKKHSSHFYGDAKPPFRTLEAELVDCGDEIAYSSHDLDDGLRAGLLSMDQLEGLEIWQEISRAIERDHAGLPAKHRRRMAVRNLINTFATDLVSQTAVRIRDLGIQSLDDLQAVREPVVGLSSERARQHRDLKQFLMQNLYQHQYVLEMTRKGQHLIKSLFEAFVSDPALLPSEFGARIPADGLERVICDYLAGMTDRYAAEEYRKVIDSSESFF